MVPVSSRLITICLRAVPFNVTVVQAYAPTSDYDDNEIVELHNKLQDVIDQKPKNDILVVQGGLFALFNVFLERVMTEA